MLIIFDKKSDNPRKINFDFFNENIFRGVLNLSWSQQIDVTSNIPNAGALKENPNFKTMEIVDADAEQSVFAIPVQGKYNTVLDASASYSSAQRSYNVNLVLGYVERDDDPADTDDSESTDAAETEEATQEG